MVSYDLRFGVGVSTILLFGGVLHNFTDLENHLGGFRNQKIFRKDEKFEFIFDKITFDNGVSIRFQFKSCTNWTVIDLERK